MKSIQTKPIGTSMFRVRGWMLNVAVLATAASALAEVRYVDVNSTNATPPYTNWITAATNIQDAVDAAVAGDEIVVTNGTYSTGGRAIDFTDNRVAVDKPVNVRSVNGPQSSIINGSYSRRCVYLTNGASLSGFTLTNGFSGYNAGGGAYGGAMTNCTLSGNTTYSGGGAAAYCALNNCTLTGNNPAYISGGVSGDGGGAYSCTLNNCTLTGNSIWDGNGGGAAYCTLNNCTLAGNSANFEYYVPDVGRGGGAYRCTLNNCIITGNSATELLGSGDPTFGGGAYECALNYCVFWGNHASSEADYGGLSTTVSHVSITGPLFVDTNGWANLRLQSNSPCINAGNNFYVTNATDLDGNSRIVRGVVDIGAYEFQGGVHYVDVNSTNATPPYTNWTTAATNIQDAVDAAGAGDEIVVTNGTYATGARATVHDNTANRVLVDKPLNVRSVNGPEFTTINGGGQFRCVYLTNGASFSGFTLTNGLAYNYNAVGGGVTCQSTSVVVSNCLITGNRVVAYAIIFTPFVAHGGGAAGGTLNNCMLTGNSASANADHSADKPEAQGGGAYGCTLNNCTLSGNSASTGSSFGYSDVTVHAAGGGAYGCTLNNCTLSGNTVIVPFSGTPFGDAQGGGASYSTLNSCALTANSAIGDLDRRGFNYARGGGASDCSLNNCTLAGNSAWDFYGGVYYSTLNNCIVYYNTALRYADYGSYGESTLNYCCTVPQPTNGVGNITNAPMFVDTNGWANLRLQPNSPCINAGNNSYVTNATDLDGNPRISGGTVDIGAYEYQWPQLTIASSGLNVLLRWPTNNAGYDYSGFTLQFTTNLSSPVWSTNSPAPFIIGGQNVVTNPNTGPQQFYRLSQ